MLFPLRTCLPLIVFALTLCAGCGEETDKSEPSTALFKRINYNQPEGSAFLGVGLWAWPLPMDYDGDGDMDMLVSCPDKPFNGLYFFENTSGEAFPVFAPPVRLGDAISKVQVSHTRLGEPKVTTPGALLQNFHTALDSMPEDLFPVEELTKDLGKNPRFNQWKMADYDGDGDLDILVGMDDWSDYGWDNAYDSSGNWVNGPLHGYVYLLENKDGEYVNRGRLQAGGEEIDVYGAPSPNLADFDGDGDLDLICGEFLDRLTYFENVGSREQPVYSKGVFLENQEGILKMDLEMIIPVAIDWDQDGHVDLIVGDEDGRVAWVRNTGEIRNGIPEFTAPRYFRQQADHLKFGALVTPVSVDWDQDGDEDIIAGNSAGHIAFIENLSGGSDPRWAEPELLKVKGEPIRIQAGENGSIQGPAEAKWGYTTLSVADWDGDGHQDIIFNSIWGKVEWIQNAGTELRAPQPVRVDWGDQDPPYPAWNWWKPEPDELVTQWRTTPFAVDWDEDGHMDLVMLDHEGYLAWYQGTQKNGQQVLLPGKRIFYGENGSAFNNKNKVQDEGTGLLRLNTAEAGSSGRRKISLADWDNDGDLDLLVNSLNVSLFENISQSPDKVVFQYNEPFTDQMLAGHTTSPTFVDWDKDGVWELLVGAEDGHFYYLPR
ncbi:Repeat domain-containing protein [Cyclobacterium lianum]|uniref:Repeat domain-containing protein n=1 Tax=Cyclobacterium lianum TaxID=388280 RepID=A0A1M7INZ2_9BACT|nr:VCBS repeat-containing protein [Cyclobacterium lianum]SHM42411.1 Repeat domain-containing protein [Cyclobacterium lianum]